MEERTLFWISLLLFCVSQCVHAQNNTYCRGAVRLTGLTGEVRSHTGPGNYQEDTICSWVIAPLRNGQAVDSVTIIFEAPFDLEYGYDFLVFYDGPNAASPELVWFTGYTVPAAPIKSSTGAVSVLFFSDQLITGRGFRFTYHANTCPSDCNGNGLCIDEACQCFGGWTGPTCSTSFCNATTCKPPNGQGCTVDDGEQLCKCYDGAFGRDCQDKYCSGVTHFHDNQGRVKDHKGDGDYLDNTNCTFIIQPQNFTTGDSVFLNFLSFNLERGYDFLDIYDGLPGSTHRHFLGTYTGDTIPPQLLSLSGTIQMVFTSDVGLTTSGFLAEYRLVQCEGGCNDHGICYSDGACFCDHGWQGANCETKYCADNCNNHGTCNNDTCNCNAGYDGDDCSICDVSIVPTCYADHCKASLTLSAPIATFSDRTTNSVGDYLPSSSCSWLIQPTGNYESIALSIVDMDLEDGEAFVRVYDGSNANAPLIGIFTGSWPGSSLPTPISTGPKMFVTFTSSSSKKVRSGFTARYAALDCNKTCEYGRCNVGNHCECDYGYTGPTCSQTECVGNCGFGYCDLTSQRCVCNEGYFGPDCTENHCSDLALLTNTTGSFSDHGTGSTYWPGSECGWLIQPPVPIGQPTDKFPITLIFHHFQLQDGRDFVSVYDGAAPEPNKLLRQLTGSFIPDPIISTGNALYVRFTSDRTVEYSGFQASYSTSEHCLNECSGNGYCIEGSCVCFTTTGPDCAGGSPSQNAAPLVQGVAVSASVNEWRWKYYYSDVTEGFDTLILSFTKTSTGGHPEFFVDYGKIPTLNSYMAKSVYYAPSRTLTLTNIKPGRYFVGVYGRETASFDLSINFNCDEAFCHGHGTCNDQKECTCDEGYYGGRCENLRICDPHCQNGACTSEYKCICNKGWHGEACDRKDGASAAQRAGIAVFVILIVVAVIAGTSFLIYRYYKRRAAGGASREHEMGAMPGVTTSTSGGSRAFKQFEDEN